jgi:hypothetical protein
MAVPGRVTAKADKARAVEQNVGESPPADAGPVRVNWLFAGAFLGAGSWLLVLAVVFAAFGNWAVAGALFAGLCLCLLAVARAGRRAAAERRAGSALLG